MKLSKNKVYLQSWLKFHPYSKPDKIDMYYLDQCNKVNRVFLKYKNDEWTDFYRDYENIAISCVLGCYFEDVISGLGLWKTFTHLHNKMYGKYLPFFDSQDYYPDEINLQDIRFLLWYTLSVRYKDHFFVDPDSELISLISEEIYSIFDEEYEFAPENERLTDYMAIPDEETDFYNVRTKLEWMILHSYMFSIYNSKLEEEKMLFLNEYEEEDGDLEFYLGEIHDDYIFSLTTNLLAMKGKDWLAQLLGESHPLHGPLLAMSDKKTGVFLYKSQDDNNLLLEHIASNTLIKLTKKSVNWNFELVADKTAIYIGIVNWMNEWWFSGTLSILDMNDEILMEEKSIPENSNLFVDNKEKIKAIQTQEKDFFKFFKDYAVFFSNMDEANRGMQEFFKYSYRKAKNKRKVKNHENEAFPGMIDIDDPELEGIPLILFFNSLSGMEIIFNYENIYSLILNTNKENLISSEDLLFIFSEEAISKDFVVYLCRNTEIDFFDIFAGYNKEAFQENLEFMLRFYKPDDFHPTPRITLME